MSDLIYVVQITDTMLGRMCLLRDLRVTLLYDCGFDMHLYLTSCLNARLPQTGCIARKMALFIISQDRQTQLLAANAMATAIIIN